MHLAYSNSKKILPCIFILLKMVATFLPVAKLYPYLCAEIFPGDRHSFYIWWLTPINIWCVDRNCRIPTSRLLENTTHFSCLSAIFFCTAPHFHTLVSCDKCFGSGSFSPSPDRRYRTYRYFFSWVRSRLAQNPDPDPKNPDTDPVQNALIF